MQLSSLLRTVLKLDAASCLAISAVLVGAGNWLSEPLGLPVPLPFRAGVLLALVGLFILWLGTREQAPPVLMQLVVFGNVGWALASLASLALVPAITGLGLAVVAA